MRTTRPIFPNPPMSFTSDRLSFRAIHDSDAQDYYAIRTDIELMKWTSTAKCDADIEATRTWMARFINKNTTFSFSVEELANPGKVIGTIGVHSENPPELGYILARKHWGRGYATESVKAFLPIYWTLERKEVDVDNDPAGGERLHAITDVDNRASRNVLRKCGFILVGEGESHGRGDARYYIEAPASTAS